MYKDKVCLLCKKDFTPNNPNQKYCVNCKDDGRRVADRKRDRLRNRKKNKYKERIVKCEICCIEFTTYYKKKKYCGSDECEKTRKHLNSVKIQNKINIKRKHNRMLTRIKYNSIKIIEMVSFVNNTNYQVSDYNTDFGVGSHNIVLTLLCPNGHEWKTTFHNFKDNNNRCLHCYSTNNYVSRIEQKIRDFLENNYPELDVIYNDRKQISPKELDFYFPRAKLAVETCGLYWHSEILGKTSRYYHYEKMMSCFSKGIRLITVFEDELNNNFDVVMSRILQALGVQKRRIYARKCVVKEITTTEANIFFRRCHTQDNSTALKVWGLFYNDDLVSVCSVDKVIRKHTSSDNILELKRFCTLPYTVVIGGIEKLFKKVKEFATKVDSSIIKSYCDMRYANIFNPVYEVLGFELIGTTKYTPHYIKNGLRYSNSSLRKTTEEQMTNKTEFELRKSQGYDRIWDCGHRTYVYTL
jgi:hypothetical protein